MSDTAITTSTATAQQAVRLRALHHDREVLVLPNAWDAMSAALIAAGGARAIATTSGGVAWAHGYADGQHLSRDAATSAIAAIAAAVSVPVSADIEGGYGPSGEDVALTVDAVIAAGAAGINLEDSAGPASLLLDPATQARRITAARQAGQAAGVEIVINARTDVYLIAESQFPDPLQEVVARAEQYAKAGADCLFVPGLAELSTIATLVGRSPLPLNIMAGPGAPTVAQLADVGVRRVSVGTALAQAAYSLIDRAARELLEHGTYSGLDAQLSYGDLNELIGARSGS
jgi:2-methylisocitrate lyase-like PEP mutase family enzyme